MNPGQPCFLQFDAQTWGAQQVPDNLAEQRLMSYEQYFWFMFARA
jgi:hypothetical protein